MNNIKKEKIEVSIFIGSSKYATNHAQTLANKLNAYSSDDYKINANPWWNPTSTLGSVLEDLINQTENNDFAIILLTSQVDAGVEKDKVEAEKKKIKYNCIYEAGLFTGALGPSKDRCFIITSGGIEDLPSDLYGIKHFSFNEEKNSENDLNNISQAIGQIICKYKDEKVHPVRGLKRPLLSAEELCRREAHYSCGGKLKLQGALVFVNTPTPVEMEKKEFSEQVVTNVLDFKIKYTYVFEMTETNITAIGNVINNFINSIKNNEVWKNKLTNALKIFKKNVNIYFVAENPGLEFCVHNADSDDAQCYLKCFEVKPVMWLDWCEGSKARQVATEIHRIKDNTEPSSLRLFRNTSYCKICEKDTNNQISLTEFGRALYDGISENISECINESTNEEEAAKEKAAILNACFGQVIINDRES